jgi:hypothetical protein
VYFDETEMQRGTRIYLWPKFVPSTPLRATSSALSEAPRVPSLNPW